MAQEQKVTASVVTDAAVIAAALEAMRKAAAEYPKYGKVYRA